jgi:hypothetical protein
MEHQEIVNSIVSFEEFIKNIVPCSFSNEIFIEPTHLYKWGNIMQRNRRMSLLAPRGHLKSSILYFYLMWRLLRCQKTNEKWFYFSYKQSLSVYHIKEIKKLIRENPYFKELKDLTDAEGTIKYSWDNQHIFEVEPLGILGAKRGIHGNVICDDILADPTEQLDPKVVKKITTIFFEQVWHIPTPEESIYLFGTPQHITDLFFEIKNKKDMKWFKFTAIVDRLNKKVLWEKRYNWDYLIDLENKRPNSFKKEMMCEPVWSADTFIDRERLMKCIKDLELQSYLKENENKGDIIGGFDIGKHRHPSHIVILKSENNKVITLFDKWLDGWEYHKQIELINEVIKNLKVDKLYYDNTRGEFEIFKEINKLHQNAEPIVFTSKLKYSIASKLQEYINTERIIIPNIQRTINQILSVNNDLASYETDEGHAESFWTYALGLKALEDLGNKIKPLIRFG